MPRRLPNLNAVKAFDAAARHESFSRAAEELNVTHAAISRHVRALEADLGVALFERHHRQLRLTPAGRRYAGRVEEALLALALDTGHLDAGSAAPRVVIDVDSDLAALWLLPRMQEAAFDELGVSVHLRSHPEPPRTLAADADLAITWGRIDVPGFAAERYLDFTVFPVCAPGVANRLGAGAGLAEVLGERLIHDRGPHWWTTALKTAGLALPADAANLTVQRTHLAMDAAARGLGVAIGDDVSSGDMLADGRLVRPCGPELPARTTYHLLVPNVRPLPNALDATVAWLKACAERHRTWRANAAV